MHNNFPLNRFDFSDFMNKIQEMKVLSDVLTDAETEIEFYGVNTVSGEFLICFLTKFMCLIILRKKTVNVNMKSRCNVM